MAANSPRSVTNTVVLTTWSRLDPAPSSTAFRLCSTRWACSSMPPSTSAPDSGSSAHLAGAEHQAVGLDGLVVGCAGERLGRAVDGDHGLAHVAAPSCNGASVGACSARTSAERACAIRPSARARAASGAARRGRRGRGNLDDLLRPQEDRRRQPRREPGVAGRGQDVVRARDVVAVGGAGHRADEDRAGVRHPIEHQLGPGDGELQVLGRVGVDEGDGRVQVVRLDDRHRSGILERPLDGVDHVRVGAEQDGSRARPMLGLRAQVPGDDLGVRGGVGEHDQLARAGQRLDPDLAEQQALGLLDVGVAGADDQVDGADALGAERHRGDRLRTADRIDLLDAQQVQRGQHRAVGEPVRARRRADCDAVDARRPGPVRRP